MTVLFFEAMVLITYYIPVGSGDDAVSKRVI